MTAASRAEFLGESALGPVVTVGTSPWIATRTHRAGKPESDRLVAVLGALAGDAPRQHRTSLHLHSFSRAANFLAPL
jgi:hypothetical protein